MSDLKEYSQEIYCIVRLILNNDDDANDIMAELFLKTQTTAYESLPNKYRKAWLRTVAKNLARNKPKHSHSCGSTGKDSRRRNESEQNIPPQLSI